MKEEIKDYSKALDKVIGWADENPTFDANFVLSLRDWIDEGKELTYSQERAIDRIIKRFRIKI